MRPIPPSLNCQHQANTAYDKLAVISENIDKLREIEQFIFELKQWLRAYIDKVRASISAENFANLTENNVFTGINTFADVYLNNGNIYWKDEYNNDIAWIKYDKEHQILTLHVRDSELSLSPNLAVTVPTDTDVDNSIVTYAFLHGLLQELESRVTITVDDTVINGSNNPPSGDAVYDFVMANQFNLVLEDTVLEDSSNGVKSSGIYAALQELQSQIDALNDVINQQQENSRDVFSSLGLEKGIFSRSVIFPGQGRRNLLTDHYYRLTGSAPTQSQNPYVFTLSSGDFSITRVYCVYPNIGFVSVIKPNTDISFESTGINCTVYEYTQLEELPSAHDENTVGCRYWVQE